MTKAKAKIDTEAQKMIFTSHGRKLSVPLDIRRGVLPRIVEVPTDHEEEEQETEDNTAYINMVEEANVAISENSSEWRRLTREEKNLLMEYTMRNTRCPCCDQRVYCAEQMCTCADTKCIENHDTIKNHLPKEKRIKKPRIPQTCRQYCPVMLAGPYSGTNPHPYVDNTGEVWDCFWENVGYIGK